MSEEFIDYCKPMLEIFDDIHTEAPNFSYEIIS